jgi:hypothetical protein
MVMVASTERIPVMTVYVPVSEAELDWLVAKKYLAEEERGQEVGGSSPPSVPAKSIT